MKRVEKLAEDYRGQPADIVWYNRVPLDGRVLAQSAFEAGYRQALEDAAKVAVAAGDRQQRIDAYGAGICSSVAREIRALADEEMKG